MKNFFRDNFIIFFLYSLAVGSALFYIYNYEKTAINVYLNQYVGNPVANAFFYYITYFGDGLIAAALLLGILIYNVRLGLYSIFTFLSSSIVAAFLKYFFFGHVNRPSYVYQWLETHHPITYVEGVELHIHNSFPSGHATQAFAIGMCLAFVLKHQGLKVLIFFIALLTSASRVYLSQHWLSDITAGSFIGFSMSFLFYYLFYHRNKFQKLDRPLFSFISS